jgi:hypothetical protein
MNTCLLQMCTNPFVKMMKGSALPKNHMMHRFNVLERTIRKNRHKGRVGFVRSFN